MGRAIEKNSLKLTRLACCRYNKTSVGVSKRKVLGKGIGDTAFVNLVRTLNFILGVKESH